MALVNEQTLVLCTRSIHIFESPRPPALEVATRPSYLPNIWVVRKSTMGCRPPWHVFRRNGVLYGRGLGAQAHAASRTPVPATKSWPSDSCPVPNRHPKRRSGNLKSGLSGFDPSESRQDCWLLTSANQATTCLFSTFLLTVCQGRQNHRNIRHVKRHKRNLRFTCHACKTDLNNVAVRHIHLCQKC